MSLRGAALAVALLRLALPDPVGAQSVVPAPSSDRMTVLDQRLIEVGERLKRIQGRLKDGQAIVTFYEVITREILRFHDEIEIVIKNCGLVRLRLEQSRITKNPFVESDILPTYRLCVADRTALEAAEAGYKKEIESIAADVEFIREAIETNRINLATAESQNAVYQREKSIVDKLKGVKGSIDTHRSGPRSF